MSDLQWLCAVLAALYFWECAGWVRRGGVAFIRWWGKDFNLQHPAAIVGNPSGGFTLAAPLPPLGTLFHAFQLPVSIGPKGLLSFVATNFSPGWRPPQSAQFLDWDQVNALTRRGKKLCHQRKPIFSTPSQSYAIWLLESLQGIARETESRRRSAIENFLATSTNSMAVRERLREFLTAVRPVRILANALVGLLFIVAPLGIIALGFHLVWLPLLLLLLALMITTAVRFARIHRRFYPAAEDERFTQTILIALAPATTLRAHDYASRPLLEAFHPLAVAGVMLAEADLHKFARRVLLDLRSPTLPVCPVAEDVARQTESFHRETLVRLLEANLRECGLDPAELCRPPLPLDESSRAYCPRCEAQFETLAATCADCGGLSLVSFGKVS